MAEQKDSSLIRTHSKLYTISKAVCFVGIATTILMMLMVVVDVILRFFFNKPILGTVEVASYMLSIIAFSAIPFVESEEGHIVIPLLFDRFPHKIRIFVNTLNGIIGVGFLALLALAHFLLAVEYIHRGKATQVLGIPLHPFIFIAGLCISLYVIILILNIVKYIYTYR